VIEIKIRTEIKIKTEIKIAAGTDTRAADLKNPEIEADRTTKALLSPRSTRLRGLRLQGLRHRDPKNLRVRSRGATAFHLAGLRPIKPRPINLRPINLLPVILQLASPLMTSVGDASRFWIW
jgi:hypothetical protein